MRTHSILGNVMEMNGRVPSLKDIKFQIAAARTLAAVGVASAGPAVGSIAALEFASHLNTPVAEAAGNCQVRVAFDAFTYIDMYPINGLGRPGKLDLTEDPKIGPGVNMVGEVLDRRDGKVIGEAQIVRRTLSDELKRRLPNQFDRDNASLIEQGYGETETMSVPCENQKATVWVRNNQNREDQEERVIPHGQMLHELVGRKLESTEAMRLAYSSLMSGDTRRQQIESQLREQQNSGQPGEAPTPAQPDTNNAGSNPLAPVGDWLSNNWPWVAAAGVVGIAALALFSRRSRRDQDDRPNQQRQQNDQQRQPNNQPGGTRN